MATSTIKRNAKKVSVKDAVCEGIYVKIPQSDMILFQLFADKMGWLVNSKQNLWNEYIKNSPQNIPLTDDDIMNGVRVVRYATV
ncbi:MAG: hypothetical protein LBM68_06580 [Bacteroidales bacterium]|nr:hypothetical protein [Bacteroidales bacterium]